MSGRPPFFAVSLPAAELFLALFLDRRWITHGRLPSLERLKGTGYIALHAATAPLVREDLEGQARAWGYGVLEGMGTVPGRRGGVPTFLFKPLREDPGPRETWPTVAQTAVPAGCLVAVAAITGEQPASERSGPQRWYLEQPLRLPEPVPVETNGYLEGQPWEVLEPYYSLVRRGWKIARDVQRREQEEARKNAAIRNRRAKSA